MLSSRDKAIPIIYMQPSARITIEIGDDEWRNETGRFAVSCTQSLGQCAMSISIPGGPIWPQHTIGTRSKDAEP